MALGRLTALYTALLLGASAALADIGAIAELREGDMRKLIFHRAPVAVPEAAFESFGGEEMDLSPYDGRIVVLNFWATWCAPCRKEIPQLSELEAEFGGEDFAVVTIATGRNPQAGMTRFFGEIGVDNLPLYRDPRQNMARAMGVLGLPVTVVLDRDGNEIARMQGDADWASDSAKAIVAALIETES